MELNETILSTDPFVKTYTNILTDEECEHFINISKSSLKRSLVSNNDKGFISNGRTSHNTWIQHDHDEITKRVGEKIATIVNMPLENSEAFQVIYYGIHAEYRQHYDSWLHDGSEKTLRCMNKGGARMKTALCYLNDVVKGGGTKMTKLNITIPAEKGKLLVFHNTVSQTDHTRHELSEHAGLPVEEGEKYAFNLWFKECNSRSLYKDFNPSYYENLDRIDKPYSLTNILKSDKYERLHLYKDIYKMKSYIDKTLSENILEKCEFNKRERRDGWVKLTSFPDLIKKIEDITGIDKSFYENINIVEYKENVLHNNHYNAYDLKSAKGKEYTKILGQRLFTLTLFLSDNLTINFSNINTNCNLNQGDILIYKNVMNNSVDRDSDLQKSILCKKGTGYLANIYIRCNNKNGEKLIEINKEKESTEMKSTEMKSNELENYKETLDNVLTKFKNNEIKREWSGLKSFIYNFKGDFDVFKNYIKRYNENRVNAINIEHLNKHYVLDEELPIQVVNNVLNSELLNVLKEYYCETIKNNVWILGDKQSNRYKAHNEPMSRFLHYECLPLIERIVGKSMKPTYTYLSSYVKGANLPPHTDRPDCEYTVSFIVDKPEGCNWNIYVHKQQQEVKHKGRYDKKPALEECEAVDCDAGGLMLFQGTDHIHFREELEGEYYNVLLLHYCSV